MAFGSDYRVKYLMREIQRKVTERLREAGLSNPLRLRVFDDNAGDDELWEKGGLTFTTKSGVPAGAGDGAWYVNENWTDPISHRKSKSKPIFVVEGTFGIESGNVGDAQKTKLSHIIEVMPRGIHGAILMPKKAEYYTNGSKKKNARQPVSVTTPGWLKSMVMACLSHSEKWNADALFIDAYDKKQLEELVYAFAKNQIHKNNESEAELEKQLSLLKCEMNNFVSKFSKNYWTKPKTSSYPLLVFDLPMKNGKISKTWIGKIHTHGVSAFGITGQGKNKDKLKKLEKKGIMPGSKNKKLADEIKQIIRDAKSKLRDGHVLLGNIEEANLITGKKVYLIMPRWNQQDLEKLKKGTPDGKGKKEFNNIQSSENLNILTLDDIKFGTDKKLKKKFERFRKIGVDTDMKLPEKEQSKLDKCALQLKEGLYSKKYRIKK